MTTALSSAADKVPVAAIAQLRSTSNKLENLVNVARCAHMAKEKGACMLFLPECFGFIGESSEQTLANAERPIDDKDQVKNSDEITTILSNTVQDVSAANNIQGSIADTTAVGLLDGLQTIARESQLWLSCGGMHCLGAPANESGEARVYNTHIIIDNHGALKAVYQKIHLFDVSIPGKFTLRESATTAPGTKLVVCDSPIGKLGLATCYDMRFPEMFEPLVQAGAQVLLFPSAFTVPTGKAHWHTLLRARAIENQCYVLAAAQYGRHNGKRESYGHSIGIDPWGKVLADAGGYGFDEMEPDETLETPTIVTCQIDINSIDSVRERMPLSIHRSSAKFSF